MNPPKIGKIKLKNPLILAPMVDVTDLPYRLICKKAGAALVFTEMLYVSAIIHKNPKTRRLMKFLKSESPIGIQITGSNIEEFKASIPYLKKYNLVDLNCGCPSDRIVGNQAGSYLLKGPKKISSIIQLLKSSGLTVTAKIRLGFNKNQVIKIAKAVEKAGADAITVHARLATQGYDTKADYSQIKKVKESVSIPVIGNGDILSPQDAKRMLDETGCDAVMIARGSLGDPLIFGRILHYLKTGKEKPLDVKKNLKLYLRYLSYAEKYKMVDMAREKYLGSKFLRGFPDASAARQKLMHLKDIKGIKEFIKNLNVKLPKARP